MLGTSLDIVHHLSLTVALDFYLFVGFTVTIFDCCLILLDLPAVTFFFLVSIPHISINTFYCDIAKNIYIYSLNVMFLALAGVVLEF